MLRLGGLYYYAKVDCHISLEKKVTNHPRGSAVKDGIIFLLVLQIFIAKVKTRTLLAVMMDLLRHVSGSARTYSIHAPAKAAWLSSSVYMKVKSKDQLKDM